MAESAPDEGLYRFRYLDGARFGETAHPSREIRRETVDVVLCGVQVHNSAMNAHPDIDVEAEALPNPCAQGGNLAKAYLQVVSRMGQLPKDQQVFKALTIICTAQPELAGRVRTRLNLSQPDALPDQATLEELHLRLVADGMWLADLFGCYEISPEQRAALLQKLGAA